MNTRTRRVYGAPLLALAGLAALGTACRSSTAPSGSGVTAVRADLRTAQSFAVLGGSTVTSTGATTVHGDLGVDPGLTVTGFPPGIVTDGTTYAGDAVALQAESDTTAAYETLVGEASTADLSGKDLGGMTLTPGVYSFASSAELTGTLTLDAAGDASSVFVFQIGSTLTTASNSSVVVVNGAQDCNVFWQVGSSATLGTTTLFKGNILALASITLTTGATVSGHVLARTAAVTMDTNDVSIPTCTSSDAGVDAGESSSGASSSTTTTSSVSATSTGQSSSPPSSTASSTSATTGTESSSSTVTATATGDAGIDTGAPGVDGGVSTNDGSVDAAGATGSPP